jgi:hypothetical protein
LTQSEIGVLEEFAAIMYDRSSSTNKVNDASLDLFTRKELKQWNTSVAFSNTFQACHAVFLPFPTNADTVSQPVNA